MIPHRIKQIARVSARVLRDGIEPLRLARTAIREHGAIQRTWELQSLVGMVRRRAPRTVVEIGTHRGGSLFCWAAVAHPDAHLVSIDLPDERGGLGTTDADLARLRPLLRPGQRLTAIRADSHDPATCARLVEVLGGGCIDFLWVDGDHSEAGARSDIDMYMPLICPGGLFAMHDIHANPLFPGNQCHIVWEEIKRSRPHREFIDQKQPGGGMGIGVLEF